MIHILYGEVFPHFMDSQFVSLSPTPIKLVSTQYICITLQLLTFQTTLEAQDDLPADIGPSADP